MVEYYEETIRDDGSHYFINKRKCPFLGFKKCLGEECSLFSITGFRDDKGVVKDFGECALVKIPTLLIDMKNILTFGNLEKPTSKKEV